MGRSLDDYLSRVTDLSHREPLFGKIEIETNLHCNRKCGYCFLATRRRDEITKSKRSVMDWSLYMMLLSQLAKVRFAGDISFHFYGEPLVNKKLAAFVGAARQWAPASRLVIFTNGDLLTERRYAELHDAGVDLFYVTRHDDDVPSGLARLLRQGESIILDRRSTMELNNRGGYLGAARDPRVRTLPCVYPAEAIIVTIDGNVLPCSCDFDERHTFGNIKDQSLEDLWNSERARAFRRDLLAGRRDKYAMCRDCDCYSEQIGAISAAESLRFGDKRRHLPILPSRVHVSERWASGA